MAIRILATGDLHIGRRPTRVPDAELAERASAARMWQAIVTRARDEKVDAVLLSGDVVDHDNRFYEATGPLERGITDLAAAGIPTYAVAGNHDWDVFPRILRQLDTPLFHFLGQGGRWEETYLEHNGERLLRIVGWSFPARFVRQSPLLDLKLDADPRVPTVGLLHADVDVPASAYAAVRLADLQARGVALWVLGHVHKPQHWQSQGGAGVLYPGSPQALNPGEPGLHGPWLIEFDGLHSIECQQLPMSLVRYEEQDVDLTDADSAEAFESRVNNAVLQSLETVAGADIPPLLLSLRLNFIGATPLCGQIDALAGPLGELERSRNGVRARIDKYFDRTRPAIDLDELAQRSDPAGVLVRTLLGLDRKEEDESLAFLIRKVTERLQEVHRSPTYAALVDRDPPPDQDAARRMLLQTGWNLLETLRGQRPEREAPR